jgi:6,7-dimethyl-8-ribityllumazine synthase
MKVLIVISRYYPMISELLEAGARRALESSGVQWEILEVPGAFEVPAAIGWHRNEYDGFIALGAVIRGETTHYDYVCAESARALQDLATHHGLAIGYGILTVENEEQAMVRADPSLKNKGGDAARACLRMLEIKQHFSANPTYH